MNHLPKLCVGVQRTAGVALTILGRGTAVAQAQSIRPPMFLEPPSDDLGPIRPTQLSGGYTALGPYGRYCSPGYGDKTGCTVVRDQVDATCCKHDVCYNHHYFDCRCDCDLVRSMPSSIANTSSAEGKAWGVAAMALFAISPCFYYVEVWIPSTDLCHTVR